MCKIIGHRGNKERYLENTLEGFRSVLKSPTVDGIEFDVVTSKDKKLFISHDLYIKHNKKNLYFHTLTYDEIRELSDDKRKYPLLIDTLKLCNEHKKQNNTILIELKTLPALDGSRVVDSTHIAQIHKMIYQFDLQNISYLISFDYRLIEHSYHQNRDIKTGLILHRNLLPLLPLMQNLDCNALIMEHSWITQKQVSDMSAQNISIFAWAPNKKRDWVRLQKMGIFGIITDRPESLQDYLHKL